jgi:hypothetical protein
MPEILPAPFRRMTSDRIVAPRRRGVPPVALEDPEHGLGYLARGNDVPRSFEQSVRRARDPRRRVPRDGNWRAWS